jgi:hypothetical protein
MFLIPRIYSPIDLNTPAIAHWKLNDNAASSTVSDDMESNHGKLYKVSTQQNTNSATAPNSIAAGKINRAIDFNSAGSVYMNGALSYNPGNNNFAVTGWFKTSNTVAQNKYIYNDYGATSNDRIAVIVQSNKTVAGVVADGTRTIAPITTNLYIDGNWHFFVFQRINQTTFELTVDNSEIVTGSNASFTSINVSGSPYPMIGGYYSPGNGFNFPGIIDDVRFFNRTLTVIEKYWLFNRNNGTEERKGAW